MSIDYGEDYEYANQKLSRSVVLKDGMPIFVDEVGHIDGYVYYSNLANGMSDRCKLKDLTLEIGEVGYVNEGGDCSYVTRVPSRHYKQGLTGQNTLSSSGNLRDLRVPGVVNAFRGIYPKIVDCIESIECGEAVAKAFHKHFAIGQKVLDGFQLMFKGECVGRIKFNIENHIVQYELGENFPYLKEMVDEAIYVQH